MAAWSPIKTLLYAYVFSSLLSLIPGVHEDPVPGRGPVDPTVEWDSEVSTPQSLQAICNEPVELSILENKKCQTKKQMKTLT